MYLNHNVEVHFCVEAAVRATDNPVFSQTHFTVKCVLLLQHDLRTKETVHMAIGVPDGT
jgi:hypothetical protein